MYENNSKTLRKGKYTIVKFLHKVLQHYLKIGCKLKMYAVNHREVSYCMF